MNPKNLRVPAIVHHKASGQGVVFLRQPDGRRRMVCLGKHGTAAAERRYREVLGDYLAGRTVAVARKPQAVGEWPTVAQLTASFLLHAEKYYRDADGIRSRAVENFVIAFRPLLHLHRDVPVDRFTVRDLGTVRQVMV